MRNLTPEHLRCHVSASCPSVHEREDRRLEITGDLCRPLQAFGDEACEATIVIDPALLSDYIAEQVRAERERCAKIADEYAAKNTGEPGPGETRGTYAHLQRHLAAKDIAAAIRAAKGGENV